MSTLLTTVPLAIVSVLVSTTGQLLLKTGMQRVGYIGREQMGRPVELVLSVVRTPQIVVGLALFGISAAFWLVVLSRLPLSVAYPFAGLTYVTITLVSKYVLREPVSAARWLGILLIVGGILIVGRTSVVDLS